MMYSIYPITFEDYIPSHQMEYKTMMVNGVMLEYYQDLEGRKVINRLVSSSLNAYLDKNFQPGSYIEE
ncbi:YlzJ-like family protein [Vallitalea okinawensis]|uniref:YlzJ-like family protein n=1 Tax=Vallitalea okinawensis TaxID=2078660 RepID=UPI001300AA05|nr:YlzJ-like family protein [Vallitalea okinawensis]